MAPKLLIFSVILGLVAYNVQSAPIVEIQDKGVRLGEPVIKQNNVTKTVGYEFQYGVHDTITGDSKSAYEIGLHGSVKGSYMLNEPDGSKRIVNYEADPIHGFKAIVQKIPLNNGTYSVENAGLTLINADIKETLIAIADQKESKRILHDIINSDNFTVKDLDDNPILVRLPVQNAALIVDTSEDEPIVSNNPETIISNLLTLGIGNLSPTFINELAEFLKTNFAKEITAETETLSAAPLYTEAIIESPKDGKRISVSDFFSNGPTHIKKEKH